MAAESNGNSGLLGIVLKIGVIVVGGLLTTFNVSMVKAVINHGESLAALEAIVTNQQKQNEELKAGQVRLENKLDRLFDPRKQ